MKEVARQRRAHGKQANRRVKVAFDENDRMVELKSSDDDSYFASTVTVNLGDKAFDVGKSKVTADLFEPGKDKIENCKTFIENLEKTRRRQLGDGNQKSELEQLLDATHTPMPTDGNESMLTPDEEVLLDVNTKRFSKKDHIFMSFFSKYGENFIQKKKKDQPSETPESAVMAEEETDSKKPVEVDPTIQKERPVYNKAAFANKYQTNSAKSTRQPSPLARLFQGISLNE